MTDQPAIPTTTEAPGPQPPAPPEPAPAESRDSVRRSKRYQRYRMTLSAAEWAVEVLFLLALLISGLSPSMRDAAARRTGNPWLLVFLYLIPLGTALSVISAAFSAVRTFLLDRRFGLSTQSRLSWLADELKGMALGGLLALLAIETLYALLRSSPQWWWVWAAAAFSAFFILMAQVAPILILPLFFKSTQITAPEIVGRLKRLADRAGAKLEGVYEVNFSRKTRAANAALAGFGRTRRILLADNLLDNFTLDEIEAVLAHEFAHHTQHHLSKAIAIQTTTFFVLFFCLHWILGAAGKRFGMLGPTDVANLPLMALAATALSLIFLPLTNGVLRRFERSADQSALREATNPRAFCSALQRLAQINLSDRTPHPLIEWIFYSHPSISTRLARAEEILSQASPQLPPDHTSHSQ